MDEALIENLEDDVDDNEGGESTRRRAEEIGARVTSCAAEHRHTTALALRRAAGSARHDLQA
jgi:hypothetical protein